MDEGGGDGRGYDAREWITTLEAMPRFGFNNEWSVIRACRREGIEERRVTNPSGGRMCLFRRSEVEELLAARAHEAWLKAQGMKRCPTCLEWKDKALEFTNRCHDCKPCAKKRYKREWARKKKQRQGSRAFWEAWGGDRVPGSVDEYVGKGAPPRAADSLKYACLDEGFSHRPCLPGEKRRRFCANCMAESCYHHPELTPAQVKEMKSVPAVYPEHQVWSYAEGR
ncbi:MAG TPA: hypothetical protein VMW58_02115 [Anaerolineae bacterium]|nr:hypothetical protein [Anaerolineae bacterium]